MNFLSFSMRSIPTTEQTQGIIAPPYKTVNIQHLRVF